MFYDDVMTAVDFIKTKTGQNPELGVVLGSGLGALVDFMEDREYIPYSEIPGFPLSEIKGHEDRLVFGTIGKTSVVAMQGRFHFYEGFSMKQVTFPVFVMKMLGIKDIIITNACGGINESFRPGDMMIIDDYVNFLGNNPLIGPNDDRFGPRFPDMSEAYSKKLIVFAEEKAKELGLDNIQKGVYALFPGPCYETAAEIRALRVMGADAVGMSTVPETIVSNYLGLNVMGIACVTNMATGISKTKHSHEEVLAVADMISEKLCKWVKYMVENWKF